MSIYESSITNPKKQLEFYKDLSEQLLQERNNYKELYEKEKEKNEKAIEYIYIQEVNSIGTPYSYTPRGKDLLEILGDKQ